MPPELLKDLHPGAVLLTRDGRQLTLMDRNEEDGTLLCKYGEGVDQISWWGADGRAEYDDDTSEPYFVSDADIVDILSDTIF